MAEIIPLPTPCGACVSSEPVSFADWLVQWFERVRPRRSRLGNADELPERLRRDMGLSPRPPEAGRHYSDYLSSYGS